MARESGMGGPQIVRRHTVPVGFMTPAANDNGPEEDKRTVTVRRRLDKSGVEVRIKVPVKHYIGVAVSTSVSPDGVLSSAIELVHRDPELNYRVFEEAGNASVVAEWQHWGRHLGLPLFIRAGDGSLMPYTQQVGSVLLGVENNRRRLGSELTRRPRFLNRRQLGIVSNS